MLLNTGMNFTAKNLITIFKESSQELLKVNQKIMEEIIERCLKSMKTLTQDNQKEIISAVMFLRNKSDYFELIQYQRMRLQNKKINFQNHPSISWKLSNIRFIINKETNQFKFNDCYWKLIAKMEEQNTADGSF